MLPCSRYTDFHFKKFIKLPHYVRMSKVKQWKTADVSESTQMIYHSKGLGKSFPECKVKYDFSVFQ